MTREEAINEIRTWAIPSEKGREVLETLIPELTESEDENLKNKSGYYKAGKFWKASTLWNATKNKIPQRVSNRYILQECTWNIGTLQRFADEVKNVQEVSLDYPIILDMNGNIIDGAHRVVKAYLEGKDIDIVYIGDDEWPEPDYDEEKAVKESEDERIRKILIHIVKGACNKYGIKYIGDEITEEKLLSYLEKQKEQKPAHTAKEMWKEMRLEVYAQASGNRHEPNYSDDSTKMFSLCDIDEIFEKIGNSTVEQNPAEWSEDIIRKAIEEVGLTQHQINWFETNVFPPKQEWNAEDKEMLEYVIGDVNDAKQLFTTKEAIDLYDKEIAWLKSLRPQSHWKPSEEQMEALLSKLPVVKGSGDKVQDILESLYNDLKKLM